MATGGSRPTVAVIIPTYRRPAELERCLSGLARQTWPADQVIVVVRADDQETLAVLAGIPTRHTLVSVRERGQVHALASGLRRVETDIVAFTDDDAVPRPDWLFRIVQHFNEPCVGGVGGRDVIASGAPEPRTSRVGILGSWGRLIGNHHLGRGAPRPVDVLKGVNMAFRRTLVQLPNGLRGDGAQAHNDLALSLWVRHQGWRLIYDPAVIVDHYPGIRHAGTARASPPRRAIRDEAYNQTAALLATRMVSPWRLLIYGLSFGDRAYPGPGRWVVGLAQGEASPLAARLVPSLQGRLDAYRAFVRRERLGYDLPS